MDFTGIIIFLLGLLSGGLTIWFVRRKGMESLKKSQEEMKQEFENISNKVLLENQNQFLNLAKSEFEQLNKNSVKELDGKKELIDSTLKEMKDNLDNLSKNTIALEGQMKESKGKCWEVKRYNIAAKTNFIKLTSSRSVGREDG